MDETSCPDYSLRSFSSSRFFCSAAFSRSSTICADRDEQFFDGGRFDRFELSLEPCHFFLLIVRVDQEQRRPEKNKPNTGGERIIAGGVILFLEYGQAFLLKPNVFFSQLVA